MERILIFGNTRESREAAQTMRRRGKQVIIYLCKRQYIT